MRKIKNLLCFGVLFFALLQMPATPMSIGDERERGVASSTGDNSSDKESYPFKIPFPWSW